MLSKPYIKNVFAKSLINPPPNIVEKAVNFTDELREQKQRLQDQPSDYFSSLLKNKMAKILYFDKITLGIVPHFLFKAKILNTIPFDPRINFLKDLSSTTPHTIHPAYQFSSPIMIRSMGSCNVKK